MAFKDEKIVDVLLDEATKVEERCDGYVELIKDAVDNVIRFERAHVFRRSNIVQEITEAIESVAATVEDKTRNQDESA
tara:strand:- start:237 stop:470 length:234 start_codon:yes stop_codon:yes gene_type:complete